MKTVLTIAGSDCSGGAGIQADLKTITAHGLYGMSAITALTAQNTMGVLDVMEVPGGFLKEQLDSIFSDIRPDAVKTGMIPNQELMDVIVGTLAEQQVEHVVVDPVMVSTSGRRLSDSAAEDFWKPLFRQASLITPNIPEAEVLSGLSEKEKIDSKEKMENTAKILAEKYQTAVLIKGGHFPEAADDFLFADGQGYWFLNPKLDNPNTHGTGCTLSSAIASNLAMEDSLPVSVKNAKRYITGAIADGLNLGKGNGPLNHMYAISKEGVRTWHS